MALPRMLLATFLVGLHISYVFATVNCSEPLSPEFQQIRNDILPLRDANTNLQSTWKLEEHVCCWTGFICSANSDKSFTSLRALKLEGPLSGPVPVLNSVTTLNDFRCDKCRFDDFSIDKVFGSMLSPSIMSDMTTLMISDSGLTGDISSFASFFTTANLLIQLDLSNNVLYGQIPSMPFFDQLTDLVLNLNYFDGTHTFANFVNNNLNTLELKQHSGWLFDCPVDPAGAILQCTPCGSLETLTASMVNAKPVITDPAPYPAPLPAVNDTVEFICNSGFRRVATSIATSVYKCQAEGGYACTHPSGCQCEFAGCDGIGGSGLVFDVCGNCGGDGQACQPAVVQSVINFFPSSVVIDENEILTAINDLIPPSNNVLFGNLSVAEVVGTPRAQVVTVDVKTTNEHVAQIIAALIAMGQGNLTNPAPLGLKLTTFPNLQGVETASAEKIQATTTTTTVAATTTPAATTEGSTGSSMDNLPLIAGLAAAAGLFFLGCLYFMCCRGRGSGRESDKERKAKWDDLVINSSHPITVEGLPDGFHPRTASMGSGVSGQTDNSSAPLIGTADGWEMKNPMFIDSGESETTTDPTKKISFNSPDQTSSGTDSVALAGVTYDAVVDHADSPEDTEAENEVEFGFGFGFNTLDTLDEPTEMEDKSSNAVEIPETIIGSKITLRKKKSISDNDNSESSDSTMATSPSVKNALQKFETTPQPLDTSSNANLQPGSVGTLSKTKKAPPIPSSDPSAPDDTANNKSATIGGKNLSVERLNSQSKHTGSFKRPATYENNDISDEPPLPTKTTEAVFEPGLYGNQDAIDEQGKDPRNTAVEQEGRPRTASVAARAKEARMKALALEQEKLKEEQAKLVHPREWSSVECLEWLKYHGFKDFRETFYNNGFEGRQLIALTVGSFAGMRSHTPERVRQLIGAIAQLRHDGFWKKPDEEPEEDPPEEVQLPGEVPRRSSVSSTSSASRLRSASVVSVSSVPDSGDRDEDRMNYFLGIKINREDCQRMLHPETNKDGVFIVRKSKTKADTFVLTMVYKKKLQHFPIDYRSFDKMYATQLGHKFVSLMALVDHFKQKDGDGLPCRLVHHSRYYDKRIKRRQSEASASSTAAPRVPATRRPSSAATSPLKPLPTQFQPGTENYEMITPTEKQKQDFKSFTSSNAPSATSSKRNSIASKGGARGYEQVDFPQETYEAMDAPQQNYEAMGSGVVAAAVAASNAGGKPKRRYENVVPGEDLPGAPVTVQEADDPYNHLPPAK